MGGVQKIFPSLDWWSGCIFHFVAWKTKSRAQNSFETNKWAAGRHTLEHLVSWRVETNIATQDTTVWVTSKEPLWLIYFVIWFHIFGLSKIFTLVPKNCNFEKYPRFLNRKFLQKCTDLRILGRVSLSMTNTPSRIMLLRPLALLYKDW